MKTTTRLGMIALAAALVPAPAGAQDSKAAVVAALEKFAEAFNARDAKRTAGVFDEKGTFVSARGESISGRAAIEKDLAASFAGALKEARIGVTAEHLSQVTPDVFVQTDFFYVAGRKDASGKDTPIALSHYLVVWVKRADGWKIAALQAMVPAK